VDFFTFAFATTQRLYRVNSPASDAGTGFGAFNLVRRAAYEAIGTHAALALRPDDDVRLGRRLRQRGFRQRVRGASDLLRVEWYPSLAAAAHGLEKNAFAGFDYNLPRAGAGLGALALSLIYPYGAVWRAHGVRRALLLGAIGAHTATFVYTNHKAGRDALPDAPALPLGATLSLYVLARAVALTLARGGIRWRDTFYPLDKLRSQTGLE
jgi:hypothetical protein